MIWRFNIWTLIYYKMFGFLNNLSVQLLMLNVISKNSSNSRLVSMSMVNPLSIKFIFMNFCVFNLFVDGLRLAIWAVHLSCIGYKCFCWLFLLKKINVNAQKLAYLCTINTFHYEIEASRILKNWNVPWSN